MKLTYSQYRIYWQRGTMIVNQELFLLIPKFIFLFAVSFFHQLHQTLKLQDQHPNSIIMLNNEISLSLLCPRVEVIMESFC